MSIPTSPEAEAAELRFRAITSPSVDLALALSLKELRAAQHRATLASLSPQTGLEPDVMVDVMHRWNEATIEQQEKFVEAARFAGCVPSEYDRQLLEFAAPVLLAAKEREIERLKGEVEKWKAMAFLPLGDNHHNAALCPHCGDGLRAAEAEAQKLREALKPFADAAESVPTDPELQDDKVGDSDLTVRDFNRARKALGGSK